MSVSALKQHKETEKKVHETLHNNIVLLTNFYPTRKEFNAIFCKDVFVKSNKTAFFEVFYYLLNILSPDLVKDKLTSWPAFDIKREAKFRSEVLQIINELNLLYEHADIPVLVSSALISPGGFKFAKFILSLSQLVLYEHLKKVGIDVGLPLKSMKNTKLNKAHINDVKKIISLIEHQTSELIQNFEQYHFKCNERALEIVAELNKYNDDIRIAKLEYEASMSEFDKKYPQYPSFESLEIKLNVLQGKAQQIKDLSSLQETCKTLVEYLSGSDLVLIHDKQNFTIPKHLAHIFNNKDELNLIEFFDALHIFLKQQCFDLPVPTDSLINNLKENIEKIHIQFSNLNETTQTQHDRFDGILKNIRENFGEILRDIKRDGAENNDNQVVIINVNGTDETLAAPLED